VIKWRKRQYTFTSSDVDFNLGLDRGTNFCSGSKRFSGGLVELSIAGEAEACQVLGGCHPHLYYLESLEGKK
jgi:hypothetical protein